MPFLTINGDSYQVIAQGATMGEPERMGSSRRAYSGNLRSTVKAEKDNWTFPLAPMTQAQFLVLRADIANAAQVPCGGDAIGTTIICEVEIKSADYIKSADQGNDFQRLVTVKVVEV